MKSLAVITARGGSKRIPKKNIREFCGKPIIQYSIESALESRIFDEVMVSTDDEQIKEIAISCGAKVPFMRSIETSSDVAMTHEVLIEVILKYKELGQEFDFMCCIYPTAPFITAHKLVNSMKVLQEKKADTVIPIIPFSFPPQRGFIIENDILQFKWPENIFKRSQDLQLMYHDCGQYYCLSVERFMLEKKLIMAYTVPYIVSELEAQDIDNEVDWMMAELKYKLMTKQ